VDGRIGPLSKPRTWTLAHTPATLSRRWKIRPILGEAETRPGWMASRGPTMSGIQFGNVAYPDARRSASGKKNLRFLASGRQEGESSLWTCVQKQSIRKTKIGCGRKIGMMCCVTSIPKASAGRGAGYPKAVDSMVYYRQPGAVHARRWRGTLIFDAIHFRCFEAGRFMRTSFVLGHAVGRPGGGYSRAGCLWANCGCGSPVTTRYGRRGQKWWGARRMGLNAAG